MNKLNLVLGLIVLVGFMMLVSSQNGVYTLGDSQNDYQVTIEVSDGWNLIQGFHPNTIASGSQITVSNIRAVFMYSPDKNRYIEIYPDQRLDNEGINKDDEYYDDNAGLYSYWVYVENIRTCNDLACDVKGGPLNKLVYNVHLTNLKNIQMKKGWNFVGINTGFTGKSLNQLNGDCNIQKVWAWNNQELSGGGNWDLVDVNEDKFTERVMFKGIIVKVSDNCMFSSGGNGIGPPELPGNDSVCMDSDGGLNYGVKGTVTGYNEDAPAREISSASDSCSGNILREWVCKTLNDFDDESYACPNGCSNGACII